MSVAENLKRIRKERGLSQIELAERAGLSRGAIQGYENGDFKPKQTPMILLSRALGCEVYELYGISEEQFIEEINNYNDEITDIIIKQLNEEERRRHKEKLAMLTDIYWRLNYLGKDKLIDYAADLADNPKYLVKQTDK